VEEGWDVGVGDIFRPSLLEIVFAVEADGIVDFPLAESVMQAEGITQRRADEIVERAALFDLDAETF
jgi:hypothetical protein